MCVDLFVSHLPLHCAPPPKHTQEQRNSGGKIRRARQTSRFVISSPPSLNYAQLAAAVAITNEANQVELLIACSAGGFRMLFRMDNSTVVLRVCAVKEAQKSPESIRNIVEDMQQALRIFDFLHRN